MDFLSPNKEDNQQSRGEGDPVPVLLEISQLFAQKGPISDLAPFSTETDSLSLFVEIPPILLANTSKYNFFPKNKSFSNLSLPEENMHNSVESFKK